jgi:hypothetical protein
MDRRRTSITLRDGPALDPAMTSITDGRFLAALPIAS